MDLGSIKLDLDKEVEGVWIDVDSKSSICVARMYNKNFNRLFEKLSAKHIQVSRKHRPDEKITQEIMSKCIAKTILLDWKGLTLNGKNLQYSLETAEKLIADESMKAFRELVLDLANTDSYYRQEEIEETSKKSSATLTGSTNGAPT